MVFHASDGTEVLVAAVSDGAGTADRSDVGSKITVRHFIREFAEAARPSTNLDAIDHDFVDAWLVSLRSKLDERAMLDGADISEYACTILGAVITADSAVYVQIGDGAIIVSTEEPDQYSWIFWPQHGEYANSTYFVTQEGVKSVLQFEKAHAVNEIAIFSDGIERLVLNMSTREVHSPAFTPIFAWLGRCDPQDTTEESPALKAYLGSDLINSRTDDDKTLVMATRAIPQTVE